MDSPLKRNIILSAVNLTEGGPLTVLKSFLEYLDSSQLLEDYKITALVHSKKSFSKYKNIDFIEFPKPKHSWLERLKFEYFESRRISKKIPSYLWLSLHDMTPNVKSVKQAVYCHNPSPFYEKSIESLFSSPVGYLYTKLYKTLYSINIHNNDFVIVQQQWIRDAFVKMFNLAPSQVIVSLPHILSDFKDSATKVESEYSFFYPAFPREFKNFEVICKAAKILNGKTNRPFKIYLTIDGNENKYASEIVSQYKNIQGIDFLGLLNRDEVEKYYAMVDCLIFPSKLETWGLPITEFKNYSKPLLVSDLPYAYETVGNYEKVAYFLPDNENELAMMMLSLMEGSCKFENKGAVHYKEPVCVNLEQLFKILLK